MKSLYLTDVYFPRINGVSTSIATFRHELHHLGHPTLLVAPDYQRRRGEARYSEAVAASTPATGNGSEAAQRTLRVPGRRVVFDPEDRLMPRRSLLRLRPRLQEQDLALVHVQTPFVAHQAGVKIGRQLGLPVIETYHTYFEEYLHCYLPWLPRRVLRALARLLSRRQCNQVDALVVPSGPMRDALRNYGITAPMHVIPTGLRLEQLQGGDGNAFRQRLGIAPEQPTLVHVGRTAFEKNIDFLLQVHAEVLRSMPATMLVIAGEGPALQSLQRTARKLGTEERVRFVGYLDRETELLDCYAAADVFVFASRTETQGLVLLEALALGAPVVSTAIMGTKDVLRQGCGALIAEDELDDFSTKVLTVLRQRDLQRQLSQQARDYVQGWSAGAQAQRLLNLYREVVEQARGRNPCSSHS